MHSNTFWLFIGTLQHLKTVLEQLANLKFPNFLRTIHHFNCFTGVCVAQIIAASQGCEEFASK